MIEFNISNDTFGLEIEQEPANIRVGTRKYVVDMDKVQEMIKRNNGQIVYRYIEGFGDRYVLSCEGVLWRYDKRKNDYVKVKFTQVKDNLQTKLVDIYGKRRTKQLTKLMADVFPELITYNKTKIAEDIQNKQTKIIRQQKQQNALIKCFNSVSNQTTYYMNISHAAKEMNVSPILIEKNLRREINSIGGLTFYYN